MNKKQTLFKWLMMGADWVILVLCFNLAYFIKFHTELFPLKPHPYDPYLSFSFIVGLYGVLAYAVSQRVREIGVRIALGARPGDVLRMIVRQGSRLALAGLAIGLLMTIAGSRVLESLLYGIPRSDPVSLGGAGLVLGVVSVLACTIPAWRASRVAPAEALRSE